MTVSKSRLIEARMQYVRSDLRIEQAIIDDAIPRAFRYARLGLTGAHIMSRDQSAVELTRWTL